MSFPVIYAGSLHCESPPGARHQDALPASAVPAVAVAAVAVDSLELLPAFRSVGGFH